MSDRPPIPRTVLPRKKQKHDLPMIVVTPTEAFSDFFNKYGTIEQFLEEQHPRAMVVCINTSKMLLDLHEHFQKHPDWNFRITPLKREHYHDDGKFSEYEDYIINYFGFKGEGRNRRYYYPVSPMQYGRTSLHTLVPGPQPELSKLYEWGQSVRDFVVTHELRFAPTAGGIASQLLRDSKFYPVERRKIPMATNENARAALPGNYYELRAKTKLVYASAYYIDQKSAHHYAAERVDLPHADYLRAYGRFDELDGEMWAETGSATFQELIKEYGLFFLNVHVPVHVAAQRYVPPYAGRSGDHNVFVFSNELETLKTLGVQIRWISAAWTSPKKDTGIAAYAKWAQEETKKRPFDKGWLKPTLLAAYGILGAKPKHLEVCFLKADKGEERHLFIGAERLTLKSKTVSKKQQTPVANTIHRGIIEAETRQISLDLARQLESEGHEVFAVYADAVILRDDKQAIPLMPAPWLIKHRLRWIGFHDSQSFESDLLKKLPGSRNYDILAEQRQRQGKENQ